MLNAATVWGFVGFLILWSWWSTRYDIFAIFLGMGNVMRFVFEDFLPPNFSTLGSFLTPALETLYMSYAGAVMSIVIALCIALLTARVTSPHPLVAWLCRAVTGMLRCVPALIWGLLMVSVFGLGSFAGAIALGLSGVGILGKAFAEALDEVDRGQLEAVRATGASPLQIVGQAIWPQFMPAFVSWSLYKLDLNIRNAAVIGMVGAGGLGFSLQKSLRLFRYSDATVAILLVFALVAAIEVVTTKLRGRLL
jgi:phosphonate transport system permease protein